MRPDEHKKKRSAQYNKKKGGNKEGKKENKAPEGKGKGPGDPKNRPLSYIGVQQQRPDEASGASNFKPIQKTDLASSLEDEEPEESQVRQKQKFRRREIVSNWTRYEITDTDAGADSVEIAAVDYTKLLSQSGTASSHFRFKDEADWEEEFAGCHADSDQAVPFLGIDLAYLQTSLQCLPLFERLGLSPSLFPENQREQMIEEANRHREKYMEQQPWCAARTDTGEITATRQSVLVDDSGDDSDQSHQLPKPINLIKQKSNIMTLSTSLINSGTSKSPNSERSEQSAEQRLLVKQEVSRVPDSVCRKTQTDTDVRVGLRKEHQTLVSAEQEDELDILLSIDTATSGLLDVDETERSSSQQFDNNTTGSHPARANTTASNPAKENTTASHPATANTTASHPAAANTTASNPAKENNTVSNPTEENNTVSHPAEAKTAASHPDNKQQEDDLEDWLDSILDD